MNTSVQTIYYIPDCYDNYRAYDLYTSPSSNKDTPLIAFIHGGAWRTEDKSDYEKLCQGIVSLGFTAASINYRLSTIEPGQTESNIQHPLHIIDVSKSIQHMYNTITDVYNPQKIYIAGHSAGAHIALMLLLDDTFASKSFIAGVLGVSGIYDTPLLLKTHPGYLAFIKQAFGNDDHNKYIKASPTNIGTAATVDEELKKKPVIIAHSQQDTLIDNEQAEVMAEHLMILDMNVTLDLTLKGDHYDIMTLDNLERPIRSLTGTNANNVSK